MKLFTNNPIARVDVPIITSSRSRPSPPSSSDFGNLIPIRDRRMINVNRTAIWATILFCFLIPLFNRTKIIPITTGIREVGDPDSK